APAEPRKLPAHGAVVVCEYLAPANVSELRSSLGRARDVVPASERVFEMAPSGIWCQSPWIVRSPPPPWLERVEDKAPCAVGVRRGEECRHRTTVEKPEEHGAPRPNVVKYRSDVVHPVPERRTGDSVGAAHASAVEGDHTSGRC